MDKAEVVNFVNSLKEKGIDRFVIRYEGGNRFTDSKSDSSRIYLGDDHVVILDTSNNFTNKNARFNIRCIPYENIDNIAAYDLTTAEAVDVLKAEGCWNDEMEELIKMRGGKVVIKPITNNTSAYGEETKKELDDNEEEVDVPVIEGDEPGRVISGYDK